MTGQSALDGVIGRLFCVLHELGPENTARTVPSGSMPRPGSYG